jgi:ubiquinone/menaquinone biosynthesis C-methylase UbiE
LVESIRKFPKQEAFEGMLADAGFRCTAHDDLTGGIVAIHTGFSV